MTETKAGQATDPSETNGAGSSSDDSDGQHALEVVFDNQQQARRKASIGSRPPPTKRKDSSSCFVHTMLESYRQTNGQKQANHNYSQTSAVEDESMLPPEIQNNPDTQSRLFTKKQLSKLAWGVRDFSNQLATMRLKLKVRNVFLLTKIHDDDLIVKTRQVARWLLSEDRKHSYTVYVEKILREHKKFNASGLLEENASVKDRLKYWDDELCARHPHTFDIGVCLGGDGTVLYASWLFQRVTPPLLAFGLGSLGFLTKFDFDQYEQTLIRAFRDGVKVSLRLRFEGTIMRSRKDAGGSGRDLIDEVVGHQSEKHTHKSDGSYTILNEIVVDRGPNATMSSLEIFGDDEHLTSLAADGIVCSTPTGSTAYNLAAGGSLSHPSNPIILLTAICAHTLSYRPLILPDTMILRIGVPYDARTSGWVSFDGRKRVELCKGDYITIAASRYPFASIMNNQGDDWISSLQVSLNWNSRRVQQKPYDSSDTEERTGSEKG